MDTRLHDKARSSESPPVRFTPARPELLRQRAATRSEPAGVPPSAREVLRSAGQPLEPDTRAFMEPRFGRDFSRVRVHTDAWAAESASDANATAFTIGQDLVFAAGAYAPQTSEGKGLLAHELTHAAQQADSSRPAVASLRAAEQEAQGNSRQVAAGFPAEVNLSVAGGTLQRNDGAAYTATLGGVTKEKEGETKTTTEASLKLKVPVWPGGRFGRFSLAESANLNFKVAGTTTRLKPGDPLYQAQLETALTLARLEMYKRSLGSHGTLSGGLKFTGLAAGATSTATGEKGSLGAKLDVEALKYKTSGRYGEFAGSVGLSGTAKGELPSEGKAGGTVGGALGGKLEYTSPPLPYYPYGPTSATRHGRLKLGASGSLSAEYGKTGGPKLGAGVGLSAGYEWMTRSGAKPFVILKLNLNWTEIGGKVESSQATTVNVGARF